MDPKGQSILKLLFNEGETVCVSNNEFGFHSIPLKNALDGYVALTSPNEYVPITVYPTSELIMVAINPINGFRTDANVQKFRSFLWECDMGSMQEQLGYFKKVGVPLSAQIFSGNRSIHSITVLDEDITDEKTYRMLYQWGLNILTLCDQNCKNPSRSTRIPGAYREPGKKQRLKFIGKRVSHKEFMDWLNQYEHLRPKVKPKKEVPEGEADFSRLSPWARIMLSKGIVFKNGRNQTWFGLAVDCALAGFTEELTIETFMQRFTEESDFKEKELLITIASAFKYVNEGKR